MRGTTKHLTITRMVEVEEEISEVTLVMSAEQAIVIRDLLAKMGPTQVQYILDLYQSFNYDLDNTMQVIYEFYNTLFDATKLTK